jgi:hypothetical protein
VLASGVDELYAELRQCHALRSEMAHLCTNLQAYVMFEVLERAWNDFMRDLDSVSNLDSLIGATDVCSFLAFPPLHPPVHTVRQSDHTMRTVETRCC